MSPSVKAVAAFIKANTKRPATLPERKTKLVKLGKLKEPENGKDYSVSDAPSLRWPIGDINVGTCPLGLVPGAFESAPSCKSDVPNFPFTQNTFTRFITWWDEQTNAKRAVAAVWG